MNYNGKGFDNVIYVEEIHGSPFLSQVTGLPGRVLLENTIPFIPSLISFRITVVPTFHFLLFFFSFSCMFCISFFHSYSFIVDLHKSETINSHVTKSVLGCLFFFLFKHLFCLFGFYFIF